MPPDEFSVRPVGVVCNERLDPARSDHWQGVVSTIVLAEPFGPDALVGLAGFSHVEVLFHFHLYEEREGWQPRSPRGRTDLPLVGVFADRGPRRPNRLGATICSVVAVQGRELTVTGLDAVDGTPVLDLKPVMRQFLPAGVRQPGWVEDLMADYFSR